MPWAWPKPRRPRAHSDPKDTMTDRTHDPKLTSWVESAQGSEFPIQNLPFGVFRRWSDVPRIGVAIGDRIVDLDVLQQAGMLADIPGMDSSGFRRDALNDLFAKGRNALAMIRARLSALLNAESAELRDNTELRARALTGRHEVEMLLPTRIGDYTDFYSSIEHATNLGSMFRDPSNPLLPNWRHLPVGYNGRTSSIVVSGTPIKRPCGQTKADDAPAPSFGPSRLLDIELEMGFLTGVPTQLGQSIPVDKARQHIAGMVLVNDWSARDIQKWEYVPLGPFLGKSFGTTVSPWVVTLDALEPFRVASPAQEPAVLPYLQAKEPGGYDIHLEIAIQLPGQEPHVVSRTTFALMYWTIFQQLAHQTVNGTNIRPGDLYASGTVSGPTPDSYGSLLELTWRGTKPITFPHGETRTFLKDGDTVILRGWCQGEGYRVGFGECAGTILPAEG